MSVNTQTADFDYEYQDDEIDLLEIFKSLKKHMAAIIAFAILAAIIAGVCLLFFVTPMYRTSFTVYVNNRSGNGEISAVTSSDISASKDLATTYSEIITGRTVLLEAAERCGMSALKYDALSDLVEAKKSSTSELITVYVQGTSPTNALYLARAIAQSSSAQIDSIVDGSSMRVVDEPYEPEEKFSPHYTRDVAIAFIAAAALACVFFIVLDSMNDDVRDEKTLEEKTGIPVLGAIPDFDVARKKNSKGYGYGYEDAGKQPEAKKPAKAKKSAPAAKSSDVDDLIKAAKGETKQ